MMLRDKLFRYFVGNRAPILSIRRVKGVHGYIPMKTANTKGFYLFGFLVEWRKPYFEAWCWNPIAKRWEVPTSYPSEKDSIQ